MLLVNKKKASKKTGFALQPSLKHLWNIVYLREIYFLKEIFFQHMQDVINCFMQREKWNICAIHIYFPNIT